MPYIQYHCPVCMTEFNRYHNVRILNCRAKGCQGTLVKGKSPLTYYDRMVEWIETHDHWDEHPDYQVQDWRMAVANDDTREGYQEWLLGQADAREDEGDPP